MNWQERIDTIELVIQTGDGQEYRPLWKQAEKEVGFNTSSFEFINVHGTLVDRKKPQSGKFDLVFYFQGADNIEQADRFEQSSYDPRPWKVTHPFYGVINGQPLSIKRVDNSLNISEITVPFWESIDANYPLSNYSIKDNTREKVSAVYIAAAESYVNNVEFTALDVSKNKQSITDMASDMQDLQDNSTYGQLQNFLNKGLKAIDNLLEEPLNAIEQIQLFLDLPSKYERAIDGRIGSYLNIYFRLKDSIKTLSDKKYFESVGGSVIAAMSYTMVTPEEGDYVLASDVESMASKLREIHDDYLKTLDDNSVSIYSVNNSFSPDATTQSEVSSIVSYTVANLFALTFETKRERIVYADKDTNLILLVHRYMGLTEDEHIEEFIKMNDIKMNELFVIKKGREIRYAK